ncbi:MAG: HAD family hydrolase [Burkholderiaceae bacterium]
MSARSTGSAPPAADLQAVVFDCDGVLVDSERITNGVIAAMLCEQGLQIDTEGSMAMFMGRTVMELLPDIEQLIGKSLPENWYSEFLRRRDEGLREKVEPIVGIEPLVAHLQANSVPYAVASGADRPKMHLTLGKCGLLPLFEPVLFGRDMVAQGKPAPDVYQLAINTLGVDAARTIVIEDTTTGTTAGVAAGAVVYGYAAMNNADALLAAGASRVFTAMDQLPELLADTALFEPA